jgi:hypothetical protein
MNYHYYFQIEEDLRLKDFDNPLIKKLSIYYSALIRICKSTIIDEYGDVIEEDRRIFEACLQPIKDSVFVDYLHITESKEEGLVQDEVVVFGKTFREVLNVDLPIPEVERYAGYYLTKDECGNYMAMKWKTQYIFGAEMDIVEDSVFSTELSIQEGLSLKIHESLFIDIAVKDEFKQRVKYIFESNFGVL